MPGIKRQLTKMGNGRYLRLSKDVLDLLGLDDNSWLNIELENGKLIVTPLRWNEKPVLKVERYHQP